MSWLTGWSYRRKFVIYDSAVDSDITDFPILVRGTDMPNSFWDDVEADGSDIAVTDSDGITKLDRDLVKLDVSEKYMWLRARIPTVSSLSDTVFYIYWGNSSASEVNSTSTYRSSIVSYWAMKGDPLSDDTDRTGNGHDLENYNGNITSTRTTPLGDVVWDFYDDNSMGEVTSGVDDFSFTDGSSDSEFSIVLWKRRFSPDTFGQADLISKCDTYNPTEWRIYDHWDGTAYYAEVYLQDGGADIHATSESGGLCTDGSPGSSAWSLISVTYDGSGSEFGLNCYLDDSLTTASRDSSGTYDHMSISGKHPFVQAHLYNGSPLSYGKVQVDEIRVYSEALGDAEIKAIYLNEAKPRIFFSQDDTPDVEFDTDPVVGRFMSGTAVRVRLSGKKIDTSLVEIIIDGTSYTTASGNLGVFYVTNRWECASYIDYSDVWFDPQSGARRDEYGSSISVVVKYDSIQIASKTYNVDAVEPSGIAEAEFITFGYQELHGDIVTHFALYDKMVIGHAPVSFVTTVPGVAIGADCYFYLGHDVFSSLSGEVLAAKPILLEDVAEVLSNGWKLQDDFGETLQQGWIITDGDGEILAAVEHDAPQDVGAMLAAVSRLELDPASVLVYMVDGGTIVDIQFISQTTKAALTDLGIIFEDEVI